MKTLTSSKKNEKNKIVHKHPMNKRTTVIKSKQLKLSKCFTYLPHIFPTSLDWL